MKRSRRNRHDGRVPKDASMPFYRELCALQVQYDQMTSALDWKDPARVRGAACGVALAWLQMEAAFIQFIERTPVNLGLGRKAKPERLMLTGNNYLLRELFRRALGEISNWVTSQDELQALRIILHWIHERLQLWTVVQLPVLSSQRTRRAK